ncbi:AIPR family protein [Candidatus Neomarinimicrobiota bacterium]
MSFESIESFHNHLVTEISAEAGVEEQEMFVETAFVDKMLDHLHEAQELENAIPCQYKSIGIRIDAYDVNTQENQVDIIVSKYYGNPDTIEKLYKTDALKELKRGANFFQKAYLGEAFKMEESTEAWNFTKYVHSLYRSISRARIILVTDASCNYKEVDRSEYNGVDVIQYVWDIDRMYRFVSSGRKSNPVTIDFVKEFGAPIDCIIATSESSRYATYLAVLTGDMLSALYDKWGTRLLERNVRAFLQARGKVNRGIRETILNEPDMFMAYNNGLTVTADEVKTTKVSDGGIAIRLVSDFQIVNGGQTCASLWHTKERSKASLAQIGVQVKLTEIKDKDKIEVYAPRISLCSNTQNRVNTADFYANDPFHKNLEQLSRNTWVPDPSGGSNQTKWFYERSRGSYDETRNREGTQAKIRRWDAIHPRKQRFDKTLLAKVENTWWLMPHLVSLGAQKNFLEYTIWLREEKVVDLNEEDFRNLVARLILWKTVESIITKQKIPGFRANIVTYTLAWFYKLTERRIDLDKIWKNQALDDKVMEVLDRMARKVRDHITDTEYNVTEWCKKLGCWEKLQRRRFDIPDNIESELIDTSRGSKSKAQTLSKKDKKTIEWCLKIDPSAWFALSRWGSLTESLELWERRFAYSMGRIIKGSKEPSKKQAYQGKRIFEKAKSLGFKKDDSQRMML